MCSRTFHPTTGLDMLKVQRISQEQAWQRTGRAGRDSEGYCYRIYTKTQFDCMPKTTVPEIQRVNLSTVALQLLALGIHASKFNFMDKPPEESVRAAFEQLKMLGAIENTESTILTNLGQKMAMFPLDPKFSKVILSAQSYGCLEEILTIIALLSGESILFNPIDKRDYIRALRQKFYSPYGDHVTLLNVYKDYTSVGQNNKRAWCHEHFVSMKNITYACEVRTQLADLCKKCNVTVSSCGSKMNKLLRCLLSGLFMNVAELHTNKQYVTVSILI